MRSRDFGHIHHYCRATALETLQIAGFRVLRWRYADLWRETRRRGTASLRGRVAGWLTRPLWWAAPDLKVTLLGGAELAVLAADATPQERAE